MAVVLILAVLAALLLPGLAQGPDRVRSLACLSNLRQLQMAWSAYVEDAAGRLPSNDATTVGGLWRGTADSWAGSSNARSDTNAEAIVRGCLGPYLGASLRGGVRCPDDRNRAGDSRAPRSRSYALNGNCHGRTNELQRVVDRESAFIETSAVFTFIDEDAESIDDGHFLVWSAPDARWVNLPAGRHGRMGVRTYVDGHGIRHRWLGGRPGERRGTYWWEVRGTAQRTDLRHLQDSILAYVPEGEAP